jgi:predicted transcriptional regulator YdeE
VKGLQTRTRNADESDMKTAKLGVLWADFQSEPLLNPSNACLSGACYGVYANYETDHFGFYTVTAGRAVVTSFHASSLYDVTIKSGCYLVFKNQGVMPQAVIAVWQEIWRYFNRPDAPKRMYETDFEVYLDETHVNVYIGVCSPT